MKTLKTLFIKAKAAVKIVLPEKLIKELPKNIIIAATVQYVDELPKIRSQLLSAGKKPLLYKPLHSRIEGQILGCDPINNTERTPEDADAFLFIGDGMFHAKAFLLKNNLPVHVSVYVYNPISKEHRLLTKKDTEDLLKKQKAGLLKFHSSKIIGVITTTKPGQSISDSKLKQLEEKYSEKEFYRFITDTIDFSELENFPFIECWVNTACPRIAYDDTNKINKPIINISELL